MSSAEQVLPLHLQIWIPFIAVSVVRNSNTMLNRSSESGHSCLVLDLNLDSSVVCITAYDICSLGSQMGGYLSVF